MSKRSLDNDGNPRAIQQNNPVNSRKENTEQVIEIAAEQLADLLLKCWLASDGIKKGRHKSNTRTGNTKGF